MNSDNQVDLKAEDLDIASVNISIETLTDSTNETALCNSVNNKTPDSHVEICIPSLEDQAPNQSNYMNDRNRYDSSFDFYPFKYPFHIKFSPIREAVDSWDNMDMFCPICLEFRPRYQFHEFECGHGVCKIEDVCKNYNFDHCIQCKFHFSRNIEKEAINDSIETEKKRNKEIEENFYKDLQIAIEMSKREINSNMLPINEDGLDSQPTNLNFYCQIHGTDVIKCTCKVHGI